MTEKKKKAKPTKPSPSSPNRRGHWYIIHTYSGHEKRVADAIMQRVKTMNLENKIFETLVPTQSKIKVSRGKKETIKERMFPGYIMVRMLLDDSSWLVVRTTRGVTGFIGSGKKPLPLSFREVKAIKQFMKVKAPKYRATFTIGEAVKIVDGPFADFLGTVESIDEEKGRVRVLVSIFGRETPVDLDFLQVSKI
jgi:transcriptional antiterminator NusG